MWARLAGLGAPLEVSVGSSGAPLVLAGGAGDSRGVDGHFTCLLFLLLRTGLFCSAVLL